MQEEKKFYRVDSSSFTYGFGDSVECIVSVFVVMRETPEGYWIVPEYARSYPTESQDHVKVWLAKADTRKKFARETPERALEDFRQRYRKHVKLLKQRVEGAEALLQRANNICKLTIVDPLF